jgi:hypothetical protein
LTTAIGLKRTHFCERPARWQVSITSCTSLYVSGAYEMKLRKRRERRKGSKRKKERKEGEGREKERKEEEKEKERKEEEKKGGRRKERKVYLFHH